MSERCAKRVSIDRQPTWLSGRHGLCLNRGLLELGAVIQGTNGGGTTRNYVCWKLESREGAAYQKFTWSSGRPGLFWGERCLLEGTEKL